MARTALITGNTGQDGSYLAELLLEKGYDVHGMVRRASTEKSERIEHLPAFEVDVQRRWPSVEKARRVLGWEARIGVREGIAQTVAWLRDRDVAAPVGGVTA